MNEPSRSLPAAPAERPDVWPLTPPQRALWFLENFNPGSSFYVVGLGLVLRGRLDTEALRAALTDTVRRHEALRTRFLTLGGNPYQLFAPPHEVSLPLQDVSAETDPEGAARAQLDALATEPFDLGTEPPLRIRLVRLGQDHNVLLLAVHHIVFDGWSTQVVLADLAAAYEARCAGRPAPLPAPENGVGAHAALLAAQDGCAPTDAEAGYWRRTLHAAPRLNLPADFARPDYRTFEGAACALDLTPATSTALRDLARSLDTTPFTVLVAAFTTWVSRLSGSDDVVIGVPLAGRTEAATHDLVGFFANTLPLRVDVAGVRSFREAVERHRGPVRELLNRQHVPFAALVDMLAPKRSANRNPYYDVCFQYLPAAERGVRFGGLELGFLDGTRRASQFDLSCDVHEVGDRMRIQFEYSTELFTERTMRARLEEFAALLREVADDREQPAVAPQQVAEVRQDPAVKGGLAGIVAAQARALPGAPAVRSAGRSLTFGDLDDAAARFAALLSDQGVSAGDRVGLLLEPTVDLAIAILGILRTGAAYVPGDVRAPAARTAEALRQAECRILVHDRAGQAVAATAAAEAQARPLLLDPALLPEAPLPLPDPRPDSEAYVIFTSGSTGRPKGVAVSHAAATALAAAAAEVYRLAPEDVVLQMASPSVDVSVEEFFSSWYAGASVFVQGPVIDDVSALVREQGLTVLNLPAVLWHEWTRQAVAGDTVVPGGVRLVIAGSDRVDPLRVRQWHAGPGAGIRLLNAYGLTEATVSSAWYDTAELDTDAIHTTQVPIGRAFPHATLYVLDGQGVPVPDGMPGELHIGGPGVALGYLGDPEGTAARFLPDPFRDGPGHRMFRTGDQVRRLPSGALDFRGRTDTQVKIRGTRIELAEIERVAGEVPGVAGFAADVRTDEQGTPRLVGYLRLAHASDGDRGLNRDRVEEWRQIHDAEVFNEFADGQEADLNASGWVSSYTMEPIPAEDMAEWRDEFVDRLLDEPPGRVLEIGCGTGMVLLPVAPRAECYVGTDISTRALDYVRGRLAPAGLEDSVRLLDGAAHELSVLGEERFDTIVINSVVQYFPSESYLTEVVENAWRLLRPGGRLLIGDVRDLTLLSAFHLSVQRFRQAEQDDPRELADSVAESVETENELCLAPNYFHALTDRLPGPCHVEVRTKAGRAATEMNGFRYDVVLRREERPAGPGGDGGPLERMDGRRLDTAGFRDLLDGLGDRDALIHSVPDARVAPHVAMTAELAGARSVTGAQRSAGRLTGGVHPADLRDSAAERGRRITVCQAGRGLLDVLVSESSRPAVLPDGAPVDGARQSANKPMDTAVRRSTVTAVREHLGRHLTKVMIPSRLVFVEEFPLSAAGKLDRSRLPDPPRMAGDPGAAVPVTALERTLAAAWEQVLGADAIGTSDNFFEVGGDSISWLQIMSRCSRAGVSLTARDVFEYQTIAGLAAAVEERQNRPAAAARTPDAVREAGLSPIQHWFMDAFPTGRDRQNQTRWYELTEGCPAAVLGRALRDVVDHHPALALRFEEEGIGRRQLLAEGTAPEVTELALPAAGRRRDTALAAADDAAQSGLSVTDGPLSRAVLLRTPSGEPDLLLWCVHHLVVDAVSWQFLDEDLDAALDARLRDETPRFPSPTASFLEWSAWSQQAAERMDAAELAHWRAAASAPGMTLPVRHEEAEADYGAAHRRTRLLAGPACGQVPGEWMMAGALTAVRGALEPWTGRRSGSVWLEFHGRPLDGVGPDTTRSVGWFTALCPFVLDESDAAALRSRLAAIPGGGIGYGRARHLAGEELGSSANVVVNYLGASAASQESLRLRPMSSPPEAAGPEVSEDAPMPFALELNLAHGADGTLSLDCVLGARYFDEAEAERFTDSLSHALGFTLASLPAGGEPSRVARFALLPEEVRESAGLAELADRAQAVDAYPLMPMQQMMLNRHLLGPTGDANYNESVLTLLGEVEPDLFRAAWSALAERHEALRTSVEWVGLPQPVQLVHAQVPDGVQVLDWSALSATRVERRLARLLEEERARPPALSGTPPYRLTLVRTGPRESRLVWIDHHILLDGWSSSMLIDELLTAYAEIAAGSPAFAGAPRPVAYRDYVRWARERTSDRTQAYWQTALHGFSAPTELPFDLAPNAVAATAQDYRETDGTLPAELAAALRKLARERHTTLGSILAAGWAAFLHRYTGDSRVCFGMALSGRPAGLGEVKDMVGLYQTTLPLTVEVAPGSSAGQFLDGVTRQSWQLGEVSAAGSLWEIYEWTGIPVSRTLFHSVLVVQNFGHATGGGREGDDRPLTAGAAQSRILTGAPLTVAVDPGSAGLRLVWDSRVFAPQTAERMYAGFLEILTRFAEDPGREVAGLQVPAFSPQPMAARDPAGPAGGPVLPPRGPVEERIALAWGEVLGTESIGRDINLFEAGANSVTVTRLHARLSELFTASEVALSELFRYPTVRAMATLFGGSPTGDSGSTAADAARGRRRRAEMRSSAAHKAASARAGRRGGPRRNPKEKQY